VQRVTTLTLNPTVDLYAEVDELVAGPKLRSGFVRREPGGGGVNVARGIQRCGGDVQALLTVGGATGAMLNELLQREGLPFEAVPIAEATREGFAVQAKRPAGLYRITLPGPRMSAEEGAACLQAIERQPPGLWVVSGSLPPGLDSGFYARIARTAQERGARVVLDTSGAALRAALEEGVYLVKPNHNELRELTGKAAETDAERLEQARSIVQHGGAEVVVLSLAEAGALLVTADQHLWVRPPAVDEVSAIGAGDSFVALLTLKLAQGRPLHQAVRYGVAAGTAAVLTPGTELFRPDDVERLYQQVTVRE
jgi:6-phosphofructokinase 2